LPAFTRAFTLVRHLEGSIPARGYTESNAHEFNAFSRNLEVGLATTIGGATDLRGAVQMTRGELPDVWKLPAIG